MTSIPVTVTVTNTGGLSTSGNATIDVTTGTINIGQTSIISTVNSGDNNSLICNQVSLTQPATIQSLSFYVGTASGGLRLGMYDATGTSGNPGKLVAATPAFTPVVGWNTVNVVTPALLQPANYWLTYLPQNAALAFRTTLGGSGKYTIVGFPYGAMPATYPAGFGTGSGTWSFYATLLTGPPPPPDTVAPSVPTGLTASAVSSVAISLSWTASTDNVGVAGYNVLRNGTQVGTSTSAAFTDSGLSPSTTYTYTVSAFDAANNTSGPSQAASATTSQDTGGTILPPDRDASANWKMAGMLSVGGIPNRTTVFATINPQGGGLNDTPAIQTAINNCPINQVVLLGPGTFTISNSIQINKAVTLRGSGANVTILNKPNGATLGTYFPGPSPSAIITVGGSAAPGSTVPLTSDVAKGAFSVQVSSVAGYVVGEIVLLDEDGGYGWQPDHVNSGRQIWASSDYRVAANIHNPSMGGDDGTDALGWFVVHANRQTSELHRISAISGNTITFDSPTTISYRTSHAAQISPMVGGPTNAGIENLAVRGGDDGNIKFNGTANSWAKNVENSLYLNGGFRLEEAFRVQIEGCYIHHACWPIPGGAGYNISIDFGSSEILVQNSISILANKVMVARAAGAGSVFAYNYIDQGFISGQGWVEIGLNASHLVGPHHVLFEGNWGFNSDSDQTHGSSIYMTYFRNWITGYRSRFTDYLDNTIIDDSSGNNGPQRCGGAHAYAYWFSFIGNVLGMLGKMSGWTYEGIGGVNSFPPKAIWTLGWVDISPQGDDPTTRTLAIRDGNYDFLQNKQSWQSTPFPIPDSLYLTSKPAFFGSNPWPWVNPSNGTTTILPAKARFDAGTPNGP